MKKEFDSQAHPSVNARTERGTEVCSRFIFAFPATHHVNAPPSPVHAQHPTQERAPARRAGVQAPRRIQAPRSTTGPSKSQMRSTAAR